MKVALRIVSDYSAKDFQVSQRNITDVPADQVKRWGKDSDKWISLLRPLNP